MNVDGITNLTTKKTHETHLQIQKIWLLSCWYSIFIDIMNNIVDIVM